VAASVIDGHAVDREGADAVRDRLTEVEQRNSDGLLTPGTESLAAGGPVRVGPLHGAERRRWPRVPAVVSRVLLEWYEGGRFHQGWGRLVDVSRGGVAVEGEWDLSAAASVWLTLKGPPDEVWVAAEVVRTDGGRAGLAFLGGCPDDLYYEASLGITFDGLI
jgi:hypothetical protein